MATAKLFCTECDWRGLRDQVLTAANPFSISEQISGCPGCASIEHFKIACEHADCWREVSCGTPVPGGYAQTCGEHQPAQRRPASHE